VFFVLVVMRGILYRLLGISCCFSSQQLLLIKTFSFHNPS
jgi:hypothetical protein